MNQLRTQEAHSECFPIAISVYVISEHRIERLLEPICCFALTYYLIGLQEFGKVMVTLTTRTAQMYNQWRMRDAVSERLQELTIVKPIIDRQDDSANGRR